MSAAPPVPPEFHPNPDDLVRPREAARCLRLLGCDMTTGKLRQLRALGQGPKVQPIKGVVLYRCADLMAWLDAEKHR